jgi:hypothetical protein
VTTYRKRQNDPADVASEGSYKDKQEIYEAVMRYCRGVDRADMSLVRSAYHTDALEHHGGFDGTIDQYIPWLEETISKYDGLMHLMGNHLATVRGDRAVAETYGLGVHWVTSADDPRNFTSGIRYIDHFLRRDGRWAISERWAVRDWVRSDVGRIAASRGDGPPSSRDHEDPVYIAQAWLTAG